MKLLLLIGVCVLLAALLIRAWRLGVTRTQEIHRQIMQSRRLRDTSEGERWKSAYGNLSQIRQPA